MSRDSYKSHLINATCNGDIESAKKLMVSFDLSNYERSPNYYTLLCVSLNRGYPDIARLLIQDGARVNSNSPVPNNTPLHMASVKGYTEIVTLLLERQAIVNIGNDHGYTPLHCAINGRSLPIVKLLLNKNASIYARTRMGLTPFATALEIYSPEIIKELLIHGRRIDETGRSRWIDPNCTELHYATLQQDKFQVVHLMNHGADINANITDGKTALHIATMFSNRKIVKLLLDRGANPNIVVNNSPTVLHLAAKFASPEIVSLLFLSNANPNAEDYYRKTPLHWAAKAGKASIVNLLLVNGANVHAWKKDGLTSLHFASIYGHSDVVRLLVDRGAHVNCTDRNERTPLYCAAAENHPNVVRTLVDSLGASIESASNKGRTPLHIAAINRSLSALAWLLDLGADVNTTCFDNQTPLESVTTSISNAARRFNIHLDELKRTADLLVQHMLIMILREVYVSEQNILAIMAYNASCDIHSDPRIEIRLMKERKIGNSDVTFYDIITADIHQLVHYVGNSSIVQIINSNDVACKYPLYLEMLREGIGKGRHRKNLMIASRRAFHCIFNYSIPEFIVDDIAVYLSNGDLRNLIEAFPRYAHRPFDGR